MFLTRGLMLAGLLALVAVADGEAAAPPGGGKKGKGGKEMVFKGIITDVNQGKNKRDEAGSITVRGHDGKGKGEGKAKGKGKGKGAFDGQRETETFRVGDRTLVLRMAGQGGPGGKGKGGPGGKGEASGKGKVGPGGKGQAGGGKGGFGGMMGTIRQLREGDIVEVHHTGQFATEIRVVGHLGGGEARGKGKAKGKQK